MSLEIPANPKRRVGDFIVEKFSSDGEVFYRHRESQNPQYSNRSVETFYENLGKFKEYLLHSLAVMKLQPFASVHRQTQLDFPYTKINTASVNIKPDGVVVKPDGYDYDSTDAKHVRNYRAFLHNLEFSLGQSSGVFAPSAPLPRITALKHIST